MCTQLPQVHGASLSLTSKSSLLASSMSWYPNSESVESVATGSSRNGSRPLHSQGWSLESSCIIFRSASFENKLSKIIYLSAATHFPRAWSCIYGFIYLGSPAPLQYFGNKNVISTAHNFFSYSWSSFSMLRFLVIRLWCAATRSSCIEINWTQYKELRNNFNLHYNTLLREAIL